MIDKLLKFIHRYTPNCVEVFFSRHWKFLLAATVLIMFFSGILLVDHFNKKRAKKIKCLLNIESPSKDLPIIKEVDRSPMERDKSPMEIVFPKVFPSLPPEVKKAFDKNKPQMAMVTDQILFENSQYCNGQLRYTGSFTNGVRKRFITFTMIDKDLCYPLTYEFTKNMEIPFFWSKTCQILLTVIKIDGNYLVYNLTNVGKNEG